MSTLLAEQRCIHVDYYQPLCKGFIMKPLYPELERRFHREFVFDELSKYLHPDQINKGCGVQGTDILADLEQRDILSQCLGYAEGVALAAYLENLPWTFGDGFILWRSLSWGKVPSGEGEDNHGIHVPQLCKKLNLPPKIYWRALKSFFTESTPGLMV